ncbi:MAG: hypothetical protein OEQ12_02275 [Nitrosopumilus sp.]|nr:hypothetical protein [Nitrosopumilus sp.]
MVKDSKKKEEKPKESPFKKFLKKRAPVYLSVMAIVIIFIVPELTKGDLQSNLPENLSEEEKLAMDTLMSYKGPNNEGLSVMDAISNQIDEKYPNEKIYDNKKTNVNVSVSKIEGDNYQVIFDFESYKEDFHYDWNVNMQNEDIKGNDKDSKYVIDLVDFYD